MIEPGLYNYWIFVVLMMVGFYTVISRGNLIKKIVGLNIFQTSVFLLYVSFGKVEVMVYLADTSDETMKMLKDLGLEVLVQTKAVRMVIGLIDVSKLTELALLEPVRRVALPDYAGTR